MGVEIKNIADLKADPKNERTRTERSEGLIVESLGQVGPWRSIAIDENDVVYAGNGVISACGEIGIERVMVVDADPNTIVAVRRTGLTEEQKRKYVCFDNRASDLSTFDGAQLARNAEEYGFDLLNVGFNEVEISALADGMYQDALAASAEPGDKELQVLVTCKDAEQQSELYTRLVGEGFKCKTRRRKAGT